MPHIISIPFILSLTLSDLKNFTHIKRTIKRRFISLIHSFIVFYLQCNQGNEQLRKINRQEEHNTCHILHKVFASD